MRPHMDQRVNALLPEPDIEGDIGVARNSGEIMVVGVATRGLATLGLHGDDGFAVSDRGEMELAVANLWIALGPAPSVFQIVLQGLRKLFQRGAIVADAPGQRRCAQLLRK